MRQEKSDVEIALRAAEEQRAEVEQRLDVEMKEHKRHEEELMAKVCLSMPRAFLLGLWFMRL